MNFWQKLRQHKNFDKAWVGDRLKPCDMSVEREREEERRKNESIKYILTISEFSCLKLMNFWQKLRRHEHFDKARVGDNHKPCDMSVEREREGERRKNESIKFILTISEFSTLLDFSKAFHSVPYQYLIQNREALIQRYSGLYTGMEWTQERNEW